MDELDLEALRKAYNAEHPKEKPIPPSNVWEELTRRLKKACDAGTPECIVRKLIKKPTAPKDWSGGRANWLSSDDIDGVLKGYTKLVPDFYYVGTVPIDFDKHTQTGVCLVSALCSLNLKQLQKKGFYRVGIVFNTDISTGSGEHWIAAFCDMRPDLIHPQMTFFDSYAQRPEPEIQVLMQRWASQLPDMKLQYNATRHQRKEAECGMFCIYFIHCSLFNIPMGEVIPDDVIAMMRPMFFKGL
jgi:hypothetical protein